MNVDDRRLAWVSRFRPLDGKSTLVAFPRYPSVRECTFVVVRRGENRPATANTARRNAKGSGKDRKRGKTVRGRSLGRGGWTRGHAMPKKRASQQRIFVERPCRGPCHCTGIVVQNPASTRTTSERDDGWWELTQRDKERKKERERPEKDAMRRYEEETRPVSSLGRVFGNGQCRPPIRQSLRDDSFVVDPSIRRDYPTPDACRFRPTWLMQRPGRTWQIATAHVPQCAQRRPIRDLKNRVCANQRPRICQEWTDLGRSRTLLPLQQ
jgi:hypothetical protein